MHMSIGKRSFIGKLVKFLCIIFHIAIIAMVSSIYFVYIPEDIIPGVQTNLSVLSLSMLWVVVGIPLLMFTYGTKPRVYS